MLCADEDQQPEHLAGGRGPPHHRDHVHPLQPPQARPQPLRVPPPGRALRGRHLRLLPLTGLVLRHVQPQPFPPDLQQLHQLPHLLVSRRIP